MKKFKVTVDGQIFEVSVEEIKENPVVAGAGKQAVPILQPKAAPAPEAEKTPPKEMPVQQKPLSSGGSGGTAVPAPMPGSIIDVLVQPGDTIEAGAVLLILEAMKMENEVTAPQPGTVLEVLVKKGDTVNSGDPLVLIG